MVEWLFLAVPWGCLRFVIVVFPDLIHLLFFINTILLSKLIPTVVIWQTLLMLKNQYPLYICLQRTGPVHRAS